MEEKRRERGIDTPSPFFPGSISFNFWVEGAEIKAVAGYTSILDIVEVKR